MLQPLSTPDDRWQSVSVDFITGLPMSNGFDSIMTITDRLTKMVHLIPTQTTATARDIAKLFIRHVIRLHGIPKSIVSDRDVKFVSHFWRSVMTTLGVNLNMSSADHPESDGQSERTNRTVIEALRSYVNERNDNWCDYIPIIEIAINDSKNESTGYSPFELNLGYSPNFTQLFQDSSSTDSNVPAVNEFMKKIRDSLEIAKTNLRKAQTRQKLNADSHRREHSFQIGEFVYLDRSHLKKQSGVTKLNPLYSGPFRIIKQNGPNNFSLGLPSNWKIHNSFHVSKLKLAQLNDSQRFPLRQKKAPPEPETQTDGSVEYYVEKIVDHGYRRGKKMYRVRWKGWGPDDDTWETPATLHKVKSLINQYENRYQKQTTSKRNFCILWP